MTFKSKISKKYVITANNEIAKTILSQLGGNKFIAMTGAKNLGYSKNYLSFQIGKNPKGVTHVKIELTSMDLYHLIFYKIRGSKMTIVKELDSVYADNLQEVFTAETGLHTHL